MEFCVKFHFFLTEFVLFLHVFALTCAKTFQREKQGVSFANFVKSSSVKLDEPKFQLASLKVSRAGECTLACVNNQECYSVNFASGSDESGKHTCELLKVDKFSRPTSLYKTEKFNHYFIKVSRKLPLSTRNRYMANFCSIEFKKETKVWYSWAFQSEQSQV